MTAAQAEEFDPALWPPMAWLRYNALIAGKSGALIVLPIAGAALLAGLPEADIAELTCAARILGMAYQASDDVQGLTADLTSGSLNGVIARGLVVAEQTGRALWLELLARGRLGQLSQAAAAALTLQSETTLTLDWSFARLSSASAGLRGHSSPRCGPMIPVIDRAVRAVAGRMTLDRESRHAA